MSAAIKKLSVPPASEIFTALEGAYYSDSYQFYSQRPERKALQVFLDIVATTPAWVNHLMAIRNYVVSVLGLKNLGHLGDVDTHKRLDDYCVGDRVGIFTLLFLSDEEAILGDSDKHLDVKVSVYKDSDANGGIFISTVVHRHNFLGTLYMLPVVPIHQLIVPHSIKTAESARQ